MPKRKGHKVVNSFMVTIIAGIMITLQTQQPYPDRAKFLLELGKMQDGTPKDEVARILGKPERIVVEHVQEGSRDVSQETWLYGTDGPTGAATLAEFTVYDGKLAYHPVFGNPPATSVISECELRKGLHCILDTMPKELGMPDKAMSTWVVKAVNALLPFGEVKCKAIVNECGRIMEGPSLLNPFPYFVCYALFDPPQQPGYFDIFGPVWYAAVPKDHHAQPRWPIEIVDNVPIIRGQPMGGFGGFAPPFESQFDKLKNRIHLRKSPLSLPK
jgi:hypothetical protein